MNRRELLISGAGAAVLAGCASAPVAASRAPAQIAPWGVDLAGMDASVRPGEDFAKYSGGAWMRTAQIPDDRTRWGAFDQLREKSVADVRAILDEVSAAGGAPGSIEQKIADYYLTYLDQPTIDARGLAPIQPTLDAIETAKDQAALAALAALPGNGVPSPIVWGISVDKKDPDRYTLTVTHAGLGLPNRTYYHGATVKPDQLDLYRAHVGKLLALAGDPMAHPKAQAIVDFESEIAALHWLPEQRRERDKTYNPKDRQALKALAPDYAWDEAFQAGGLGGIQMVVVRELDAIGPLAALYANTPLDTLRAHAKYHALRSNAALLPKAIDDEVFDFYGRKLNGQPQQRERAKRAVDAVDGALGEAVGTLYVARHFPPEAKAQMLDLVENLRIAFGRRIRASAWMSEETKLVALEKLAAFRPKIGYPDEWRDYSALEIVRGDAFGNAQRAAIFDYERDLARLDKPTDRNEWLMTPQTVNAYYYSVFNEIVFPAAILQPPFFDPNADPAVNYGAIGGVIGHEMGHGFDDQGSKSDAKGVLRTWWNGEDVKRFAALGDRLAAQYSEFEALPGLKLNGRLGLGENIGDNGGLQVAYEAYTISRDGQEAPVLDGYSGDQRFFLGWGQVWRTLYRDEALRNQVKVGPHSPGYFRANGPVRNMDSWYAAFAVEPTDALYLPPTERVTIW